MSNINEVALLRYNNEVGIKFQLYNGLFTALPFHKIEKTGVLLSMFLNECTEGYENGLSPTEIVDQFFEKQNKNLNENERMDLLFRFNQYAERQVVLFDALEDAAFSSINDLHGVGTIQQLLNEVVDDNATEKFEKQLNEFAVQLVLTAHPTQFYTGAVLGIINETTQAVQQNNVVAINSLLQQLGRTPFLKKQKPTPYDEALSLIWFLENIFYYAAGDIVTQIAALIPAIFKEEHSPIKLGFWPGGDRDGNPNVNVSITIGVAAALRNSILKCYYKDVLELRKRLTFSGVDVMLTNLEKLLYHNVYAAHGEMEPITVTQLQSALSEIKNEIITKHQSLFVQYVEQLIYKVHLFGLHFATLDIRQESSVHGTAIAAIAQKENILASNYAALTEPQKMEALHNVNGIATPALYDGLVKDTLLTMAAIKQIQKDNGAVSCNRYIISQCKSSVHVMEVYALLLMSGWNKGDLMVDIVPLFETIEDLSNAAIVMEALFKNSLYKEHLELRGKKQIIMVGFSDGTKDGGYLMANYAIYKAKKELTKICGDACVKVVFFDGRGGPPSRGGGKTHRFYASMGSDIANKEIQTTIQGQTISSSFGTVASATFNMAQLLSAGIGNALFSVKAHTLSEGEEVLLQKLSAVSLQKYIDLKEHPFFMDYLLQVSPMHYYGDTNIGSRPAKRSSQSAALADLRAIPYVGAWSQIKQNVTGFYGVGTALAEAEAAGDFPRLQQLYKDSLFIRTLFENCEMVMKKCFFPLTAYVQKLDNYAEIWKLIHDEYQLTLRYILQLSGNTMLMDNYPIERVSIEMREKIVLPLLTIQQYAIRKVAQSAINNIEILKPNYEKLIVRSSFGIINAARNSV